MPANHTRRDRSGKPLVACILLGLSFIFTFHVSALGPVGMRLFLLSVVGIESAVVVLAAKMYAAPVKDAERRPVPGSA